MTSIISRASVYKMMTQFTSLAQNFLSGFRSMVSSVLISQGQLGFELSTWAQACAHAHTHTFPVLNLSFSKWYHYTPRFPNQKLKAYLRREQTCSGLLEFGLFETSVKTKLSLALVLPGSHCLLGWTPQAASFLWPPLRFFPNLGLCLKVIWGPLP